MGLVVVEVLPGTQKVPQAQPAGLLCIPLRLVLGDDGTVGAGVAARTAVQAGGSIDDVLVITLADSTGGASVRAGATAHAGRSDLVSHGKHLHKICDSHCTIQFQKSKHIPLKT